MSGYIRIRENYEFMPAADAGRSSTNEEVME